MKRMLFEKSITEVLHCIHLILISPVSMAACLVAIATLALWIISVSFVDQSQNPMKNAHDLHFHAFPPCTIASSSPHPFCWAAGLWSEWVEPGAVEVPAGLMVDSGRPT